jgi:hypothetical protein
MIIKIFFIDRKKKIRFSGCWCILFIYTFVKKGATFVAVLSTATVSPWIGRHSMLRSGMGRKTWQNIQ